MVIFMKKSPKFSMITRKIKIVEYFYIIFPVLFSTLRTFTKVSTTFEGGGLHVRKWDTANPGNDKVPHVWVLGPIVRICRFPPPQFCSHFHERSTQCWIEWKINVTMFIFWVMADCIYNLPKIYRQKKVFQKCYNLQEIWGWYISSAYQCLHLLV